MYFTRDPGPLRLPGFRGRSLETLRIEIDRAGLVGSWVVADLSLGAWRGQQVAREFCAQLAVDLSASEIPATEETDGDRRVEIAYADVIGEFIDAEARGDRATLASLDFARRIREEVFGGAPRLFLVLAPRHGLPWETENILFVRLLTQALRGTRSVLALVAAGEGDPEVPPDWTIDWQGGVQAPQAATENSAAGGDDIVGLVPGVIAPELEATLRGTGLLERGHLTQLPNGYWLVPPAVRRHATAVPRLDFDRLGECAGPFGWLDAYAQFYGNKMYVEPWFLFAEGRRRFAEGGTGITLRLMERAISHIRVGLDWGILQAYAQGLRVAAHRFVDAAGIVDPPATLPADLRSFLLQSKGWGLVMIDDLPRAEECFRQARELTEPGSRDRREYLYLLNISALCRLKAGEIESALALERDIEERRARLAAPDRRLHYVNSINIARLYRRRGELENAEQYFSDAFATTLGARTESDAIHANVILARLHSSSGRHAQAFTCWMRAGLHWAASGAPEAMGARVARQILGETAKPGTNMPEAIAASLSASIVSAATASGIPEVTRGLQRLALDGCSAPVFVQTELALRTGPHAAIDCALLSFGVTVFGTVRAMEPRIVGGNSMRLRVLLYTLIEALAPPGFLTRVRTIVVDDSLGREMPATPDEVLAACVRLGVRDVAIERDEFALTADMHARIERCLRVRVGSAVERIAVHDARATVFFKRYLPPTALTVEGSRLLAFVEDGPTVGEVVHRAEAVGACDDVLRLLRRLEHARVVSMDPPTNGGSSQLFQVIS